MCVGVMQHIEKTKVEMFICLVRLMVLSGLTDRRRTALADIVTATSPCDKHTTSYGFALNLYGVPSICSRSSIMKHLQFHESMVTGLIGAD
ncbi:hypothetical protein DPMN_144330 [Dreissena polymorpha]|uniref:Uncharacterized protein n=1 Tax=Dreissena polymorpha TaxID=45954 RepID=A0A9D4GEP6_DREPO|nr:hypothetical protein DPMN_144330 [Dreissena polymorpha]